MKKTIHYIGLDVHKNSIAMAIAVEKGGEIRSYGAIGGFRIDGGPSGPPPSAAPTGRKILAQGNALGSSAKNKSSPVGAEQSPQTRVANSTEGFCRSFRARQIVFFQQP